jgi:predicted short-subunit dehydrogenase-like oxidoreductase (DUF2520 family)
MSGTYALIGAGRCGLGLAAAMCAAGLPMVGIVSRSATSRRRARRLLPGVPVWPLRAPLPAASCYLVTVADDALAETAAAIAPMLAHTTTRAVIHTSGLHPAAILQPCGGARTAIGSLHPLFPFPPPSRRPPNLAGAFAAIEGEPAAERTAYQLARRLQMRPRRLPTHVKPLYHAAAAVASNLTHVVIALAKETLGCAGFRPAEVRAALAPLVHASCGAALVARGLERLTGALARDDAATVAAHLAALPDDVASAYRAVALAALPRLAGLPRQRGATPRAVATTLTTSRSCASVTLMPNVEGG